MAFPQLPHLHPLPLQRIQTRQTSVPGGELGVILTERMNRDTDCPDPLHDWPLPSRYVAASAAADARLAAKWKNRKCKRCNRYGWIPSADRNSETFPFHAPFRTEEQSR